MIKVVHDGTKPGDCCAERCCNCRAPTHYWYAPKDVAVCPDCASTMKVSDVPTKAVWCAKEARLPAKPLSPT
jgi:hypothetical protein